MNTRYALISAAIVGILAALLSSIPILNLVNCVLCGWLWLAGIAVVWLYRYFTEQTPQSGQALFLGLITGVIGGLLATVIEALLQTRAAPIPPETMAQLQQVLGDAANVITAPGTAITLNLVFNLLFYSLFGVVGALIGAAIFKPKA